MNTLKLQLCSCVSLLGVLDNDHSMSQDHIRTIYDISHYLILIKLQKCPTIHNKLTLKNIAAAVSVFFLFRKVSVAKAQITDPIERRQILCLGNGVFFVFLHGSSEKWLYLQYDRFRNHLGWKIPRNPKIMGERVSTHLSLKRFFFSRPSFLGPIGGVRVRFEGTSDLVLGRFQRFELGPTVVRPPYIEKHMIHMSILYLSK